MILSVTTLAQITENQECSLCFVRGQVVEKISAMYTRSDHSVLEHSVHSDAVLGFGKVVIFSFYTKQIWVDSNNSSAFVFLCPTSKEKDRKGCIKNQCNGDYVPI